MKRKSFFFTLFVLVFGVCGTLGYFNFSSIDFSSAVSQNVSVWDGEYVTNEDDLTSSDWFDSTGSTYYIRSAKGLSYFAYQANEENNSFRNRTIVLETDIDLNGFNWTPVGEGTTAFQGQFEGNGHTIYNMNIDTDGNYAGFFGSLSDFSRISDLHFENVTINVEISSTGTYNIGAVAGSFLNTGTADLSLNESFLSSVSASGLLTVSGNGMTNATVHVGGLVGNLSLAQINRSRSNMEINLENVAVTDMRVGGLVGTANYLRANETYFDGSLDISSQVTYGYVGGLVGFATGSSSSNQTELLNDYVLLDDGGFSVSNSGTNIYIGGLVGRVNNAYFALKNTYFVGDINANTQGDMNYVSGLVGYLQSPSSTYTTLEDSFYVGTISGTNFTSNGLYSLANNLLQRPQTTGLYYNVENRVPGASDYNSQMINLDDLAKTRDFYSNERYWTDGSSWNFDEIPSIWEMSAGINGGYPYLTNSQSFSANNDDDYSNGQGLEGEGTADNPYLIRTAGDLGYVSFNLKNDAYYSMQNDIDLSGKTWQPIGSSRNPFSGVFDGNGFTISGLTCSLQERFGYHALFGVTENAVIKNLTVRDIQYINEGTESDGLNVGTIVAYAKGDTYLINCTDNQYGVEGTMIGDDPVYAVGKVDSSARVYVFYGEKSINVNGELIPNSDFYGNINLSGTTSTGNDAPDVRYGFDLEINTDGGSVYSPSGDIYKGRYHLPILPKTESLQTQNDIYYGQIEMTIHTELSSIDATYGTSLAQLSHLYGITDVLIKKGFKAQEYIYLDGTTLYTLSDEQETAVTDFSVDFDKLPMSGINVRWNYAGYDPDNPGEVDEDTAYRVKVIYNAYEKKNFNVVDNDLYTSNSDVQVDENGFVYKYFYMEYNSFLAEYPEIFDVPTINGGSELLRDGVFDIVNLYTDFPGTDFDDKLNILANNQDISSIFVDSTLSQTLYAEWKGKDLGDDKYTASINFVPSDNIIAGKIENIKEAIDSIVVTFQNGDDESDIVQTLTFGAENLNNGVLRFNFDTLYSDKEENFIRVQIKLKDGYIFSSTAPKDSDIEYNARIDTNFGEISHVDYNLDPVYYNFAMYTNQKAVNYKNLCEDYSITYTIQRLQAHNDLIVGYNLYTGLSPKISDWTSVSVLDFTTGAFSTLQSLISSDLVDEENTNVRNSYDSNSNTVEEDKYIGYDYIKNRVLTSNDAYDSFELSANFRDNNRVVFRYNFADGTARYFLYQLINEEVIDAGVGQTMIDVIHLYEIEYLPSTSDFRNEANYQILDECASLNNFPTKYVLNYYAFSTFALIYSTDTNSVAISNFTILNNDGSQAGGRYGIALTREKIKIDPNNPDSSTKIDMTFENVIFIKTSEDQPVEQLRVSTEYTQAVFSFNAKYLSQEGELLDFGTVGAPTIDKKPILSSTGGVYPVTTTENIEVSISSNDYMRFFANRGQADAYINNEANGSVILYANTSSADTTTSFNIKVELLETNMEEGQEDSARQYMDSFNSNNALYFGSAEIGQNNTIVLEPGYWGTSADGSLQYVNDRYNITLHYQTADSVSGYGLRAGYYELTLVCTDVLYDMNFGEKFVDYGTDIESIEDIENAEFEEENSQIVSNLYVNSNPYTQEEISIQFDDQIIFETYMTENFAYELWGWYVKGSNYSRFVQKDILVASSPNADNHARWQFDFSDRYSAVVGTNLNGSFEENNGYNITVYAIYQRKHIAINLSDRAIVEEENGQIGETVYYWSGIGLSFTGFNSTNLEQGMGVVKQLEYVYRSADQSGETQLSNFTFRKGTTGNNLGYYISGYRLYDINGNVIMTAPDEDGNRENIEYIGLKDVNNENMQIDLYAVMKALIEAGQTEISSVYEIRPIIRQKTATIFFHSGTGTAGNLYGDELNGEVFDSTGSLSTNTVFRMDQIYFGRVLYLNNALNGFVNDIASEDVVVDNLFFTRTGYTRLSNGYWVSGNTGDSLNGSILEVSFKYFNNSDTNAELHFYMRWQANSYTITFHANGGTFDGEESIILTTNYDSNIISYRTSTVVSDNIASLQVVNTISRLGYGVSGWNLDNGDSADRLVFGEDFILILGTDYSPFDEGGYYKTAGSIHVYAIWVENPYTIKIMLNGANSYTLKDDENDIPVESQSEFGLEFDLKYESTFAEMFLDSNEENLFALSELVPTRLGYVFEGFYAVSGNIRQQILDDTIFSTNILSSSQTMTEDIVLTIYAGWTFDANFVSLNINSNVLPALTYNAGVQNIYLAQYFALGYDASGYEINLDENGKDMQITLPDMTHSVVTVTLSSTNAIIDDEHDLSFAVRNVGDYSVFVSIVIDDDAGYLNLGRVYEFVFEVSISVIQADLIAQTPKSVYVENVRRIMDSFVTDEFRAQLAGVESLNGLATLMQSVDDTIVGAVDETLAQNVYDFLMMKYYLLISTNNGEQHRLYRAWTYDDYQNYLSEDSNAQTAELILNYLTYFDFYDYKNTDSQIDMNGYDDLTISSEDVENLDVEISIEKVAIKSYATDSTQPLQPRSLYEMRLYLGNAVNNVDSLANYNVIYDENDDAYIIVGNAYLLPQILTIENQTLPKTAYYDGTTEFRQVSWQGDREFVEQNLLQYYKVDDNLYISAELYTSTSGDMNVDTEYAFLDETNFLFFDNVFAITQEGENYQDCSNNFKLVLAEDDIFTILNTDGIANLTVTATYLTDDNGAISFEEVEELLATGLLRITRVTYNISGQEESVYATDGLEETSYSAEGVLVYEILQNNANSVSIFISPVVTSVTFASTASDIGDYISLYKWTNTPIYYVDGTMDTQGGMTVDISSITMSEEGLTQANFYAIYTDMVLVNYDLNFPEGFDTSYTTTTSMKLGVSTADSLNMPTADGFKFASVKARTPSGELLDFEDIFRGANGTYIGITDDTRHSVVNLEILWAVDDIQYEQRLTNYSAPANDFTYLNVGDVVNILNLNEDLYDYTYTWYFNDSPITTGERLTLEGGGSFEESGNYRLVVTATLKSQYYVALADTSVTSSEISLDFSLQFMRNLVEDVYLPEDAEMSVTYDGAEHINDWIVEVEYFVYDSLRRDYSDTATISQLHYVTTGSIYFRIYFNGGEVTSMRDAGEYRISVCFDEGIFDISGVEANKLEYIFTINPMQVDLTGQEFAISKQFNSVEPALSRNTYIAGSSVPLLLSRQQGEDVGEYNLYFAGTSAEFLGNFNFTLGDVVLFENGQLTPQASTTPVGTFTITASGMIRLSYEYSDENPMALEAEFSADGYSVRLTENFTMQILRGEEIFKELPLTLFDVGTGTNITNDQVLEILRANITDVTAYLAGSQNFAVAYNGGTYVYNFTLGDEFSKYYSSMEFAPGYSFTIEANQVDVSNFVFNKVYDGTNVKNFDLSGKVVDLDSFSGVYVQAIYRSAHVGTNIRVDLSLQRVNTEENLGNYVLSANYTQANITPLDATLSFALTEETFTYGEVTLNGISNLIDSLKVTDEEGVDVTSLLVNGYYNIDYNLSSTTSTNAKGFVYVGNYQINVVANFQDFNMTIQSPTFEVSALEYSLQLPESYIQISVFDRVQEYYSDSVTIQATGDVVELHYIATDLTVGQTASMGKYDLSLAADTTTFLNGSIIVSISAENALEVLSSDATLYMQIDDTSILQAVYNGQEFSISGSVDKTITLTNGQDVKTSTLSFFVREDNGESIVNTPISNDALTFTTLQVTFEGRMSVTNANRYRLSVVIDSDQYTNVVLAEDYALEIAQVEIDVSQFGIQKTYDGSVNYTISQFNEKVTDDVVSILAQFESAVAGTGKNVSLFLTGEDMNNYVLSQSQITGEILKADAYVTFTSTNVSYGVVSQIEPITYTVKSGGTNLLPSQYSLTLQIEGATYSTAGYLEVGTYNVTLSQATSTNYNIILQDNRLTVSALNLTLTFENDGEFIYEYNSPEANSNTFTYSYMTELYENCEIVFTRESGTSLGNYHILSAMSNNRNYTVSVADNSENGAFQIVQARERIYLLLSDEAVVDSDMDGITATMEYDGNLYDQVSVQSAGNGKYQLVLTSSQNQGARQTFDLNYYTYNSNDDAYYIIDTTVENLSTNIQFLYPNTVRNVGRYEIYASGTTSSTNEVKLGKNEGNYCYYLEIVEKQLYFLQSELSKTFDNKDAIFEYDDASGLLSGIVSGETLGLNVRFISGEQVAKYVGFNYNVVAEIFGATADNYNLNFETEDGTQLVGVIDRASIIFVINNQSYTYGDDFNLEFTYRTDVDLTGYDMSRIRTMDLVIPNMDQYLSTSGALNVGEYDLLMNFVADDFAIGGYIIDNVQRDELQARVIISAKELSLSQTDTPLVDIFTKTYDETNVANIRDEDGSLRFDVVGIRQNEEGVRDVVELTSATYASQYVGNSIQINFNLTGVDSTNYTVSPWLYGVIKAIEIGLQFDYRAEGGDVTSNVDDNKLQTLSTLAFPFMSTSYLTANSASTATNSIQNFPTSLTGREGFAFNFWTMEFENIENASVELSYLENLANQYDLEHTYIDTTFAVVVDNGENTVRFINALLTDENDTLGFYYKNHEDIVITFHANWGTNQYRITILLANADGESASLGTVELDDNNPDTENETITTNYLGNFDYDSTLTLRATANAHAYFFGFYDSNGNRYTGSEPFITITREGNVNVFTITNIRQTYNLVVRYASQQINIIYDLSNAGEASVDSVDFVDIGGGQFRWQTDFLTVQDLTVGDLPEIVKTGYTISALTIDGTTLNADEFVDTDIASFVQDTSSQSVTLTFVPTFDAVGVVVTLNYGYDNITREIVVPFGQAYQTASEWEENPTREGYTFDGWFDQANERVLGTDIVSTTDAHSLTAHWTIAAFRLELISPNSVISNASITLTPIGDSYVAETVNYQTEVTFTLTADTGYEISAGWAEPFAVVINEDGTANITLTMPGQDYTYTLPVLAKTNTITLVGDHLEEVKAYVLTDDGEEEITITDNQFSLVTGRDLKVVVTPQTGYVILDDVMNSGTADAVITHSVTDNVLTATISGINLDTTLTFFTEESRNQITIAFDDASLIDIVDIDGRTYTDIASLPTFTASTGSTFIFQIRYKHGYDFASFDCVDFDVTYEEVTEGAYYGYYRFTLSNIKGDGEIVINSTFARYTLTLEVISYNENREQVDEPGNRALANGLTSITAEYNSSVIVTYQVADLYTFAGWSRDGVNIFSDEGRLNYTITQDETIYAIFSTLRFDITLSTYSYYTIYSEYGSSREQDVYTQIPGGRYFDNETGDEIGSLELYYGASKTIRFTVPTGYSYYGYGYRNGDEFVYLDIAESIESEILIDISTLSLDETMSNLNIFMVVRAYSVNIELETKIDIDGTRENDVDVGFIALQDSNGSGVNRYGYVEGTRVHYLESDFEDGQVLSNKHFTVVAYTGDVVYIRARVEKAGYRFYQVVPNRQDVTVTMLSSEDDSIVFALSNLTGGVEGLYVEVLFKPIVNVINLAFTNNGNVVEGGAFSLVVSPENQNKVWTSGREYTSLDVSAYTDSTFEVVALIRAGYIANPYDLQIDDPQNIVEEGSVTYSSLSVTDYGYTGMIRFRVSGYLGVADITIGITPLSYTVNLMEENTTLTTIDNVQFGSLLNLAEDNMANINILDDRIYFANGRLRVNIPMTDYNFEGYFTYPNGAGKQYIDANGNAINQWQESGYVLNNLTSKYELADNAYLDEQTGKITINLYIYWSFNKTRISFEFVPGFRTSTTAQDMVSGVDYSNSWFYETSPLYIEVSFNTDIRITAPEVSGYRFYQFVISQRSADGTWLSDVISYSNEIPWSTNEYDRIVECRIQVVYFAQVNVTILGGEGTFNIYQEGSDTQANVLVREGFVDTSKPFSIQAEAGEGYDFLRWVNTSTGVSSFDNPYTLQITGPTNITMNLQGLRVTLDFADYQTTYGQITNLQVQSLDNSYNNYMLGGYSGDNFFKILTQVDVHVGDKVTFVVNVDFGFGISWNRDDITFGRYVGNNYYFEMTISPEDAEQTLDIIPTFEDEVLAIYISRSFVEEDIEENTTDANSVNRAGYVTYNGDSINFISYDIGQEIRLVTVTNIRYEIASIRINNYDNTFDNMSEFFTDEGVIVLSTDFLDANNIVGTIEIEIEYRRLLWENDLGSADFEGEGTSSNPYKINTVDDLILMMKYVNNGTVASNGVAYRDSSFELTADLQIDEKFWTPIGTEENSFNGYFNFNDHTVSGIFTAYFYSPVSYNGLFGVLGPNANIVQREVSLWYVYLIVGLVLLLLILLIILILANRRNKKRREELSKR